MGRPPKIEPDHKKCTVCLNVLATSSFPLEPTPGNPTLRRNQCKDCRNKQKKERNKKNDIYRKRYRAMSEEERKEYIKKKSQQNTRRFKTNPEALARKKDYERTDKGIYNRYKNDCSRRGRKARGISMCLTLEEFSKLINSPCHYCGGTSRGVDRIDSEKSYTLENSMPCCRICNQMKNNLTPQAFFDHIVKILNHSSPLTRNRAG